MSKRANPTIVGVFVLGGLALAITLLLLLGGGALRNDYLKYVLFFEGSVNGLRVGAPVSFRGVKIGNVTKVFMQVSNQQDEILIPVHIEIERGQMVQRNGKAGHLVSPQEFISEMVDRGLRGQLQMQSILTGQLLVQLDFFPDQPARLIGCEPNLPELPTVPSPLDKISRKLEGLPIEEIVNQIANITAGLDRILNSAETNNALSELTAVVTDLRELLKEVHQVVPDLGHNLERAIGHADELILATNQTLAELTPEVKAAAAQFAKTVAFEEGPAAATLADFKRAAVAAEAALRQTEKTMMALHNNLGGDSALLLGINQALDELSRASRAIRSAASYLERHPESLLRGKGGE